MRRHWLTTAGTACLLALAACAGTAQAEGEAQNAAAAPDPAAPAAAVPATAPIADGPLSAGLAAQETTAPMPEAAPKVEEAKKGEEGKKDEGKKEEAEAPAKTPLFTVTATTDAYYENNFNDPFNDRNALRVFDVKPGPHFNYAEFSVQLNRDGFKQPFGFRVDPCWGPQAKLFNAFEPSDDEVWEHLQQAYVSLSLDKSGTRYVDFGKWTALCGYEVPEAAYNFNYSRSILYGFAEPFYHTGFRIYNYFSATDYVNLHIARGWNNVTENNNELMFGATGFKQWKQVGFGLTYLGGDEPGLIPDDNGMRNFVDLVLTYVPSPEWLFALNSDYGQQEDVRRFAHGPGETVRWYGVAGYIRRVLDDRNALTLRGEIYDDPQGFTTGLVQTVGEVTFTYEYKPIKYVIMRAEFRHDQSDQNFFPLAQKQRFGKDQDTVGVAMMLAY
jgi:hypothetical protein